MVACVRTNVYEEYGSYKTIRYIGTGMLRKVRKGISYTYAAMGGNTLMIVLAFYVLYIIIIRWEYVKIVMAIADSIEVESTFCPTF